MLYFFLKMSSVSGYDSLEAVNLPATPLETSHASSRLSFSNPHYMGPDLEALVYRNTSADDRHAR